MLTPLYHVLLLRVLVHGALHPQVSSCTGKARQSWNRKRVQQQLEDWLDSFQAVKAGHGVGTVQEQYYERVSGKYGGQETGMSRRTVGKLSGSVMRGLAWQWRGDHSIDGFLYGRVDRRGRFTGSDITFLYPDLLTGRSHKQLW